MLPGYVVLALAPLFCFAHPLLPVGLVSPPARLGQANSANFPQMHARSMAVGKSAMYAPLADLTVSFQKNLYAKDEDVVITVKAVGKVLVESDLKMASTTADVIGSANVNLGPIKAPGGYGLHLQLDDNHYLALLIFSPNGNQFELTALEAHVAAQQVTAPTGGLTNKFVQDMNKARMTKALKSAATKFPQEAVASIGSTLVICTVTFAAPSVGLVVHEFCIGSVQDLALEFVLKANEEYIDILKADGLLNSDEAKTLKLWFGFAGVLGGGLKDLVEIIKSPSKAAAIMAGVSAAAGSVSVVLDNDAAKTLMNSSSALAKRSFILYQINKKLP